MTKTIGTITTYDGDEHPYLRGHKLRIVAVLPRAAAADFDPDREGRVLSDDDELAWNTLLRPIPAAADLVAELPALVLP